ncbi:hypothetical protein K469DRAFT_634657 [Zopfia rhizophila CBS 207.26]|uniref:NACHT domain-containing protein n=1 Tax=Zopfia rhizophila CBS 207.26 TaxID=1314779 RepID=A0A6A6E226_9PEZI|nr:hypothetical protein K469DRAFT_634657 [Zopfia rhizophila CBS 207.26]
MELLTAIGLAANIVQFVEFGARLLSEANEVYHSTTGLTNEHVELQDIAENLKQMVNRLNTPYHDLSRKSLSSFHPAGVEINGIASSAKTVADDLIAVIQKLKVNDASKRGWRSFRQALSTLWNKDKIENLQKRLDALRNQLSAHTIIYICSLQNSLVVDLKDLKEYCEDINSARKDTVKQLLNSLQEVKEIMQKTTKENLDRIDETIRESKLALKVFNQERQILESLLFDTMHHRYHAITDAHRRTFDWIFEPRISADPRSRIEFKNWLLFESGIFWVSGKPGSGKSTLMKYICDSPQTKACLETWAQNDRLATAAFYFWMAGTEMQRSQRGLLQQLLFEILRECPDFISTLCPDRWMGSARDDWSLTELRTAFEGLQSLTFNTKICFFIDGLDEYDGDHLELMKIFQSLAKVENIKLCVSSRPWPCFEDSFGIDAPHKLYLQDWTVEDINRFAQDKLEEIPGFIILRQERQTYAELVSDISRKAQGVFLWVFLVVKSLRDGLTNGDSLALLRQRLEDIPSDLEPFFDKLINSVDKIYQRQMAVTFEVAIRAPEPLSMLTYWFLEEEDIEAVYHAAETSLNTEQPDTHTIEDRMIRRLNGRYKGLLEAVGVPGTRKVNFIHRTVRDYLRTRTVHRLFAQTDLSACTKAFKAILAHAKYCRQGRRRFNSQDLEHFIIFARWAERDCGDLDWDAVDEVGRIASRWFAGYDMRFLCEAIRFGFTSYLDRLLSQDHTFIRRLEEPMLRAALETQIDIVNRVFGIHSSYDMLCWLLRNGANPNVETSHGPLFLEFVSEGGMQARRRQVPYAYSQWEQSLSILLRFGADFKGIFSETKFISALPYIGRAQDMHHDLAAAVLHHKEGTFQMNLHRHLNVYSTFFEHGLDPNCSLLNCTLWELWLWYITEWQTDHGLLEEVCIRAMKLFLSYNASPFQWVSFNTDRIGGTWSVSGIVDTFFTEEARNELRPVLDAAMRRWRERRARSPDSTKRVIEDSQNWVDDGHDSKRVAVSRVGGSFN